MPNKPFDKLNELDAKIRRQLPVGMTKGTEVKLKIELIAGFELFNTRPYHNYETWSDGYRITEGDLVVEREDLDDAVNAWIASRERRLEDAKDNSPTR